MKTVRLFGLDPGSQTIGYSLLLCKLPGLQVRDYKVLEAGVLQAKADFSHIKRAAHLHESLLTLLKSLAVDFCVVEKAFVGPNPKTALVLGQARGALITAMTRLKLEIFEIAATEVKQKVAGHGLASKSDVAQSLYHLLGFQKKSLPFDASDAVAIALAFGLSSLTTLSSFKNSLSKKPSLQTF